MKLTVEITITQFCNDCGGDYSDEMPCICELSDSTGACSDCTPESETFPYMDCCECDYYRIDSYCECNNPVYFTKPFSDNIWRCDKCNLPLE